MIHQEEKRSTYKSIQYTYTHYTYLPTLFYLSKKNVTNNELQLSYKMFCRR